MFELSHTSKSTMNDTDANKLTFDLLTLKAVS